MIATMHCRDSQVVQYTVHRQVCISYLLGKPFHLIYSNLFIFFGNSDAPWCEIRPSHASSSMVLTKFADKKKDRWEHGFSVKSRNEPRNLMYYFNLLRNIRLILG